jgi:hypothetical protein
VGAVVAAPGTVTANDGCDGSTAVQFGITYPDSTTGSAWPAGGLFPIGTTTLTWTSTDTAGNQATATRTIEVQNHQLVDLSITLAGSITGNSSRSIRISAGGGANVTTVAMTGANGTTSSAQVPVATSYTCMAVKDVAHSLTKTFAPTLNGTKWAGSVTLAQGETNDDDKVDILDFGTFVASRGTVVPSNHPANFNGDTLVNNVDLTFISFNFFKVGEVCNGYNGAEPLARVAVRDLRRMGMGYLAVADLTGDGWIDEADVAHYMQFGAPLPAEPWMPSVAEN